MKKPIIYRSKRATCIPNVTNIMHIPHFQELLEGAVKDFLVVVIEGKIFCQNAIHQFSHKLADPELAQKIA